MTVEACFLLVGAWLIVALTVEWLLRHHHKWHIRAVDRGVMSEPRRNATAVLYVCAYCGEVKSTVVADTYKLEDLRRPTLDAPLSKQNEIEPIRWTRSDELFAQSLKVRF